MMMKNIIYGFLMLLFSGNLQGQITGALGKLSFEDTLTLQPVSSWINMSDPVTNILEIGNPGKVFFDTGYLDDIAVVTDADDYYSNNCNDHFYITIPWSDYY